MKNLAIIIGVSKYDGNSVESIPACEMDAKFIKDIIDSSGKFSDILMMSSDVRSVSAKNKLIEFVSKHKDTEVNEVFFYFSGHGHFDGSEFYYIMSDYNTGKLKQTTIENSEIDNFLRGLKPNMAVKIVDACNSGVGYIKDTESIVEHIKATGANFSKCYFMFSSHNDQPSYASSVLSYFTKSFCKAIYAHESETIRYKDIVDFISDEFSASAKQKPLFVAQADFTEYFIDISDSLRKSLSDVEGNIELSNSAEIPQGMARILSRVKEVSKTYKGVEFIKNEINLMKLDKIPGPIPEDLQDLFEVGFKIEESPDKMMDPEVIGTWLDKDKSSPPLLASSSGGYRQVSRRVPKGIYALTGLATSGLFRDEDDDEKFTTKTVSEWNVTGFRCSEDFSFVGIVVSLSPKYAALKKYTFYFFPILSRTKFVAFSRDANLIEVGFNKFKLNNKSKWLFSEETFGREGAILDVFLKKVSVFFDTVLEDLRSTFSEEKSSSQTSDEKN